MAVPSTPLPTLAAGLTIQLLRRVWYATLVEDRRDGAYLLDSSIFVRRDGALEYVRLRDLTLAEAEATIAAVKPRFVVRYYATGLPGTQVATFVNRIDADDFASGKRLHGRPAFVQPLTRGDV